MLDMRSQLISVAKSYFDTRKNDPSHDFDHAIRVLRNAELINLKENADQEIIIPASLFHDAVIYSKNDDRSAMAQKESAELAAKLLKKIPDYPQKKIESVAYAIQTCSFSKNIVPESREAKIIQDADALEATGVIAIMRTFSSGGSMNRALYHSGDPFCQERLPDDMLFSLDLFYTRLMKVIDRMHTREGHKIAAHRTDFLKKFIEQAKLEL